MATRRIGIDFGGVVLDRTNEHDDKVWSSKDFLALPHTSRAFHTIALLVKRYGRNNVFIVSKATEPDKVRAWLRAKAFYKKTGMKSNHVRIHRTRDRKVRTYIRHNIDTAIDDRLEILQDLLGTNVSHLYYFGKGRDCNDSRFKDVLAHVTCVRTWKDVEKELL